MRRRLMRSPLLASFSWDQPSGRYRDVHGRYVSQKAVRDAVDAVLDAGTARMQAVSRRLLDGSLDLASWQQQMAAEIKAQQLAAAMIAHGGKTAMTQADYGWTGQRIREQYGYLRAFSAQIVSGEQSLSEQVAARAALYGQAARATYEGMRARDAVGRGENEERNVLGPADHCPDCVSASAKGWAPLGTLIPIGSRRCKVNCRCRIERRRVDEPLQTWEDATLRRELPATLRDLHDSARRAVVVPTQMRDKVVAKHAPDADQLARYGELLRDWEYAGLSPTSGRLEVYGRLDGVWHTAVIVVDDPRVPVNILTTFHRLYERKVLARARSGRIQPRQSREEGK